MLYQSVPGKEVCQRCLDLEPVLRGRHWKDIKNQIHNQIQSQKKQQFHAQMDLQECQEQQEQIQNQKKQYLVQMNQQDKEQTQNQRKQQQYHVQMDQHDQDNMQNKKKQQYHTQLDHENQDKIQHQKKQQYHTELDHLQINKKQLCHGRPDHQDHIHVHKKQLYQLGEGLQNAPLDQDASLLTGSLYGPDGSHRAPAQSLLERDPTLSLYPLPHRTVGPNMDQLLSRTEWADESLAQHYSVSRQLDRNLLQDAPAGGDGQHPGHVHF